jgi:hypothetical protein
MERCLLISRHLFNLTSDFTITSKIYPISGGKNRDIVVFFRLFTESLPAKLSRRDTVDFLEDSAKIGVILKTGAGGDVLYCVVSPPQKIRRQKDTQTTKVIPEGKPYFAVENAREVVFADIYRIGQFPAGYVRFGVPAEVEDRLFYKHAGMRRKDFSAAYNCLYPRPEFRGRNSRPMADNQPGILTQGGYIGGVVYSVAYHHYRNRYGKRMAAHGGGALNIKGIENNQQRAYLSHRFVEVRHGIYADFLQNVVFFRKNFFFMKRCVLGGGGGGGKKFFQIPTPELPEAKKKKSPLFCFF